MAAAFAAPSAHALPPIAQDHGPFPTRSSPAAGEEILIDASFGVTDPDTPLDSLVYDLAQSPSNGTASVGPGGLARYTPSAGFVGTDSFVYVVDDGTDTDTGTVTVTVTADLIPVAFPDSAQVSVHSSVEIDVLRNDTDDDDVLSNNDIEFTQGANGGSVTQGCLGNCGPPEYTPPSGFVGEDSFTYRVLDSLGAASNFTTVTVQVIDQLPPPPDAVDDDATTVKDVPITINVLQNDTNVTTIAALTSPPSQGGTVVILTGQEQVQYTPPPGFRGTETFQYQVQTVSGTDTATVTVTVENRAPVANDDSASTTAGLAILIPVLGNDVDLDGDVKTITSFTQGANGAVVIQGDELEYTPTGSFTGSDSFTYTIDDGFGGVATGTVTVVVVAGNAPPTAVIAGGDRVVADSNSQPGELVSFDGTASFDADGEITNCGWSINGVTQDISCSLTQEFSLPDGENIVTLTVLDDGNPSAESAPVSVTITVVAPGGNQPPTAIIAGGNRTVADSNGAAGESVSFDGTASSDVDGLIATYQWSVNGQIVAAATSATPTLQLNDGVSTVRLVVTDNDGDHSLPAAVTITVQAADPGPTVAIEGGNRSLPDGDNTPGELVPFSGSATDANGSVDVSTFRWIVNDTLITAANGQASPTLPLAEGTNSVTLTATDNQGTEGSATVTVTIGEPNQIADLPGLTPNQESTANATEDTCSRLLKADPASLSEEERNLRATCGRIFENADNTAAVTQALDAISGEQITSQQTTAIDFSMAQLLNVGARLQALRMGSRGFSTAGLNFGNPIGGVPISALASLGKLLFGEGGASGDDDEGGLLDRRLGIFVNGSVRWGDKDATSRESGFEFESQGLTIGADYRFTDGFVAGLALGYATGDADFDNDAGTQDSDGYSGTVYGTWYGERGYFDAIASYGQVGYDSVRNINIASLGITDRASGDTDADQWALGIGTGYDFGKGAFRFGPTISLNYVKIEVDGFTETTEGTSGLAMRFDDQSADSLTAKFGAQLAYSFSRPWGILTPQARFEFVKEFRNDSQQVIVRFANDISDGTPGGTGSSFVVFTDEPDERFFNWAVGFSATFANGFAGFIDYESTESLDTITMQDVSVGLRYETKFR